MAAASAAFVRTITPTPLPPLSELDPLTKEQWKTFFAVADAIIPRILPQSEGNPQHDLVLSDSDYATIYENLGRFVVNNENNQLVQEYLKESASDSQEFRDTVYRLFSENVPTDLKKQLTLGLTLLKYGHPKPAIVTV